MSNVPVEPVSNDSTEPWVLALLVALLCAIVLSLVLVSRAKGGRDVAWVRAHVTVTGRPGPAATFEARPGNGTERDHVLSVVPSEVSRSTTVEENP